MEGQLRTANAKLVQLGARVEDLEKALNDLAMQLSLFVSRQEQSLANTERLWQRRLSRIEALEYRMQEVPHIQELEEKLQEIVRRDQAFELLLARLLEQFDIYSKEQFTKNPVSTNIMATFVVPKYEELVRHGLDWKSPSFYTHHQGYKIRLGVRGHKIETDLLLLSLFAEPGEYDERLNWPALYNFQVEIVNKRGGENMSFCTGWNCWSRPRHNMESLLFKKVGYFGQTYVLVECSNLTDYLDNNSVEIRVSESPMAEAEQRSELQSEKENSEAGSSGDSNDEALPEDAPKQTQVIQEVQLPALGRLLTTIWLNQYSQLLKTLGKSMAPFYTHPRGYKLALQVELLTMFKHSDSRVLHLDLFAIAGEYDQELKWPAEFDFQVGFVNKQGRDNLVERTGMTQWNRPVSNWEQLPFIFGAGKLPKVRINTASLVDFVDKDGSVEIRIYGNSKAEAVDKVGVVARSRRSEVPTTGLGPAASKSGIESRALNDLRGVNSRGLAPATAQPDQPNAIRIIESNEEDASTTFILPHLSVFFQEEPCHQTSPAFYTHRCGYKLCLGLRTGRNDVTNKRLMLITLYAVPGEFGAQLKWPARYNFQIDIVNQCVGGESIGFRSTPAVWFEQMEGSEPLRCWGGILEMADIPVIYDKLVHVVHNDMLELKVRAVPSNEKKYIPVLSENQKSTVVRGCRGKDGAKRIALEERQKIKSESRKCMVPEGISRKNYLPVVGQKTHSKSRQSVFSVGSSRKGQVKRRKMYSESFESSLSESSGKDTVAGKRRRSIRRNSTVSRGSSRKHLVKEQVPVERYVTRSESCESAISSGSSRRDSTKSTSVSRAAKFMMPHYQELIAKSLEWTSRAIYTHNHGYKLCLAVKGFTNSNGVQFLVLMFYRMPGEYDHMLRWPVSYNVQLEIVNKRGGNGISFGTGKNVWRQDQDGVPLFFKEYNSYQVHLECSSLVDFVFHDSLEFKVQFKKM